MKEKREKENKMLQDERKKLEIGRERLKKMILKQAARARESKKLEDDGPAAPPPEEKEKKQAAEEPNAENNGQLEELERERKRDEMAKLKKYYRSR